ncbi:FAD binding domain protein, partial [Vibrio parahaemolyticus V-223/04]
QMTL